MMIRMRVREIRSCPEHRQAIIVLDEVGGRRPLAIAADPDESCRLARERSRRPGGPHPIYEFLEGVLRAFDATPTRAVLDYTPGAGLGGSVFVLRGGHEVGCPLCRGESSGINLPAES